MSRNISLQASRKPYFTTRRHPVLRWGILAVGLASLGVVIGKVSEPTGHPNDPLSPSNQLAAIVLPPDPALIPQPAQPLAASLPPPALVEEPVESQAEIIQQGETIDVVVEKGATLSKIFANLNLPARELDQIVRLGDEVNKLTRLRPGESLTFNLTDNHELQRLSYALGHDRTLHVVRGEDGAFKSEIEEHPLEYRLTLGSGEIHSSFYQAAVDGGLSPDLVMRLADIFGWKINFISDIQEGDRFSILYESVYKDGEPVTTGDILAASFTNNGQLFQAVRYTDKEGHTSYYTPEGKSLKRGFLRYPVEFSRISSRFSNARMHPVLHTVRAHKGVDLAAPTGTPIRAAADGKISFQGWKGGYGKVVMIQHDGTYSTVYGHMSRFSSSLKQGARVKQGDIIGYVGSTGHATGPHLHYEFRVNGVHKDPLTVALPEADPIPSSEKARFLAESAQILAQMNRLENEIQTASVATRAETARP